MWLQTLRRQWNEVNEIEEESNECDVMKCSLSNSSMTGLDLSSKYVYECLNKSSDKTKWQIKWETRFNQSMNWEQVFSFHLFAECDFLRPIWHAINIMVRRVCNTSLYDLEQSHTIILGVGNIYVDFIIAYAKWIIWKARNMIVFEQQWFDTNDIYIWIQRVVNNQLYSYKSIHYDAIFPRFSRFIYSSECTFIMYYGYFALH